MKHSSSEEAVYLLGTPSLLPEPLGRYMPPVPDGVASAWLGQVAPAGAWVLDPFGASPRLPVEAARAGYRILVTANNPVTRFLIEMAAAPPSQAEMQAALAELAASFKGSERIEPHIRSLYFTTCARCGTEVEAEVFLWEQKASAPYSRIYHCPKCGDSGEHPATPADIQRAAQFGAGGLHRARALERVADANDPDRAFAEEALSVYLPRAVYAIFTLINKLDSLRISREARQSLYALLIHACDQSNNLWKHPPERERRRQLMSPPRFRENNIWLALERGIQLWTREDGVINEPVTVTHWPALPPETGGVCIFQGRLKELPESSADFQFDAICSALPRPNQAFWSLSALWAGWLWGREAAEPFKSVLRRQRYDWVWHTTAIFHTLSNLFPIIKSGTPFLGLIGEAELGFLAAALVAADAAGFSLQGVAVRAEENQAQVHWVRELDNQPIPSPLTAEKTVAQAATRYLEQRGEPASSLRVYAAALAGMSQARIFRQSQLTIQAKVTATDKPEYALKRVVYLPSDDYSSAMIACRDTLTYRGGFLKYGASDRATKPEDKQESLPGFAPAQGESPASAERTAERERPTHPSESAESGKIWLRETHKANPTPQTDRVEMEIVNYLLSHPTCSLPELDAHICGGFRGLFTPDPELVRVCLESYAEPVAEDSPEWQMHPQDQPAARRKDIAEALGMLMQAGERLGFQVDAPQPAKGDGKAEVKPPLRWLNTFGQAEFWFYTIASGVIGEILLTSPAPPHGALIVLPGSRANLVMYKLRRDPRLGRLCDPAMNGWRFLKFRHLRWILEHPLTSRDNLDEIFSIDPLTYSTSQLRLL